MRQPRSASEISLSSSFVFQPTSVYAWNAVAHARMRAIDLQTASPPAGFHARATIGPEPVRGNLFLRPDLAGEYPQTQQTLIHHAVAADRQGDALAHVRAQELLKPGAVADWLTVELEHEIPDAKIGLGCRRTADHRTDLHTARAQRVAFIGSQIAKAGAEGQFETHIVGSVQ